MYLDVYCQEALNRLKSAEEQHWAGAVGRQKGTESQDARLGLESKDSDRRELLEQEQLSFLLPENHAMRNYIFRIWKGTYFIIP